MILDNNNNSHNIREKEIRIMFSDTRTSAGQGRLDLLSLQDLGRSDIMMTKVL